MNQQYVGGSADAAIIDDARQIAVREAVTALFQDAGLMMRLWRTVEIHARLERNAYQGREIVADVICDALAGEYLVDAHRVAEQVHDEVRRRAQQVRRARNREVELDDSNTPAAIESANETNDGPWDLSPADLPLVLPQLRIRASGDEAVLQLLTMYEQRRFRRRDARDMGMTISTYRAARARLTQYALDLLSARPQPGSSHRPLAGPTEGGSFRRVHARRAARRAYARQSRRAS